MVRQASIVLKRHWGERRTRLRFGEKKWMRELERVLGKKTVEDEIFAETAKHAHEEKVVPGAPAARG
jgi:hypothetical protein